MIRIFGVSDDLIEIEGDIREEFGPPYGVSTYLAFSDGTLLSVVYDDNGFWRIHQIDQGGSHFEKTEGKDLEDDYSDVVILSGPTIRWAIMGTSFARVRPSDD